MKAGFTKERITPPIGTAMMGFSIRDRDHGCETIHDDLFVRALFLTHADEEVLIMGFDLCFITREYADRFKGAIGRKIDLSPKQILLNTSHIHSGPSVGNWAYADYTKPDKLYQRELNLAVVNAACRAKDALREVTMWAGATHTALPMNRRRKDENGKIVFEPDPDGVTYDSLPICLLKDMAGKPVSLIFSVSCHPSIINGFDITAEYPGVAMAQLDEHLGNGGSLFLQGVGGDSKPVVVKQDVGDWRRGSWEDITEAGGMVAREVIEALDAGLEKIEPEIHTHLIDMAWPMVPSIGRTGYEKLYADPTTDELMRLWAERQITRLNRGEQLPTSIPISCHGVQLGRGLRLIGLEGEAVAELGLLIRDFYGDGVTFPLGYTNGAQLYLPTSGMLKEGGYEVESYFEYGHPAPLAEGLETILTQTLHRMRDCGIG